MNRHEEDEDTYPDHWSDALGSPTLWGDRGGTIGSERPGVNGSNRSKSQILLVIRGDDGMVSGVDFRRSELVTGSGWFLIGH